MKIREYPRFREQCNVVDIPVGSCCRLPSGTEILLRVGLDYCAFAFDPSRVYVVSLTSGRMRVYPNTHQVLPINAEVEVV